MLYLGIERDYVDVYSAEGARAFLLGGEPFAEEIIMWWNFVARTHEEIVEAREDWENDTARFGHVPGHGSRTNSRAADAGGSPPERAAAGWR